MAQPTFTSAAAPVTTYSPLTLSVHETLDILKHHKRALAGVFIGGTILAYGGTLLIAPTYTAKATFVSPQQQQNSAAAALASLGALSGLAGAAAGIKNPGDQYVALMQSATIADRIVDRFKLQELYESKFKSDARKELASNVRINSGKKDNLIYVEVDDHDPKRAADMANAYVEELKRLNNGRVFFQVHLEQTKEALKFAQVNLQKTGFTSGALRSEPKAAAETFARLQAQLTASSIKLSTLRQTMNDSAPEVQQLQATMGGLQRQLAALEQPQANGGGPDYVSAYREFKYQETLFDIFARQYELARLDESRESSIIQVLDPATPPDRRSKPARSAIAVLVGLALEFGAIAFFLTRRQARRSEAK
jgi:uncharacterized protein involved in exopolysaccharide biosynthesis